MKEDPSMWNDSGLSDLGSFSPDASLPTSPQKAAQPSVPSVPVVSVPTVAPLALRRPIGRGLRTFSESPNVERRGCPKRQRKTIQRKRQEQMARLESLAAAQQGLREVVRQASEEVSAARRTLYTLLKTAKLARAAKKE